MQTITTTTHKAASKAEQRVAAAAYAAQKKARPVRIEVSAPRSAFRSERAARRTFSAVLASLVCHELDDELFQRVISKHPRCDRALDDLLNDLQLGPAQTRLSQLRAARENEEFEASVDADFDGLS